MNIRETGSIDLLKTIVHVIDQTKQTKALVSNAEIDMSKMDSKVKNFIQEHIRKSIRNGESKLAKFHARDTPVQKLSNLIIQNPEKYFVKNTQLIAQWLYNATPSNATPGCIVAVVYTNSTENFLALIKLDKNDAISYEKNDQGYYELVYKGNALPFPSKKNKLLKFATIRNTITITDQEWDFKPGLIILDRQVEDFSRFFYKTFLNSEFLLTDEHKSEKLMDGLGKFFNTSPIYNFDQQQVILKSFGQRLMENEEFTVEEAAEQIFSSHFTDREFIQDEIIRLEDMVLRVGMGDTNLKGVMTDKIEKQIFGIKKIITMEGISLSFPNEMYGTQVEIYDSKEGDGKDIKIKNVHIKQK